jgi:hypothetical protein
LWPAVDQDVRDGTFKIINRGVGRGSPLNPCSRRCI